MRLDVCPSESLQRHDETIAFHTYASRDKLRVLLIDDDAADAAVIKRLAAQSKQLDLDIKICLSLNEGRRLSMERPFDIVFVDYWLDMQTSIEFIVDVTRRLAAPCILMTSLDEPDIRRIAFRAGVRGFLSKKDLSIQAIEAVALAALNGRVGG